MAAVATASVTPYVLLGLLAVGPRHGYDLKQSHDQRLPLAKPVAYGQVYATLDRLARDGLVVTAATERASGPDRTSYRLTDAGRRRLEEWLDSVEPPAPYVAGALLVKVMVALFAAGPDRAVAYLTAQRAAHVARLRELTAIKTDPAAALADIIAADYAVNHLDADLRWLEATLARVAATRQEARP